MLRFVSIGLSLVVSALAAGPPSEVMEERYRPLWNPSPFALGKVVGDSLERNPIRHYVLGGVSKLEDGYHLILFDRRDPAKRMVIRPGSDQAIKVEAVSWSRSIPLKTTVLLSEGPHRGEVGFDRDFERVRRAANRKVDHQPSSKLQLPLSKKPRPRNPEAINAPR